MLQGAQLAFRCMTVEGAGRCNATKEPLHYIAAVHGDAVIQ